MDFKLRNIKIVDNDKLYEKYVVRGATLVCSAGSHKRRLNLPKCHGVYAGNNPLVHIYDCKTQNEVGLNQCNITFFGICGNGTRIEGTKEIKTYQKKPHNSADGSTGVLTGYKCCPKIVGNWYFGNAATQITDGGASLFSKIGRDTVTTASFLVCKYGGIIKVLTSGQEADVKPADFVNSEDYKKVTGKNPPKEATKSKADRKTPKNQSLR